MLCYSIIRNIEKSHLLTVKKWPNGDSRYYHCVLPLGERIAWRIMFSDVSLFNLQPSEWASPNCFYCQFESSYHRVICDEYFSPPKCIYQSSRYSTDGLFVFTNKTRDDNRPKELLSKQIFNAFSLSLLKIMTRYCRSNYPFNCYRGRQVKFYVWFKATSIWVIWWRNIWNCRNIDTLLIMRHTFNMNSHLAGNACRIFVPRRSWASCFCESNKVWWLSIFH